MRSADEAAVRRMAKSIQHRGPDDEGFLFDKNLGLGHLRLSIIDLSEAAHQPMSDESGRYSIIYNGEIYNYLELRDRLSQKGAKFFSNSDTEVILRLYLDEGPEAVKKLNGMFAFVIWDKMERTLFAARDRLGIKPFYYYQNVGKFYFRVRDQGIVPERDRRPSIESRWIGRVSDLSILLAGEDSV